MRRGLDTDDLLDRLRQERQILARLEHPHITRLLDGGSTSQGQPYLVMEYVDGVALDQYCDQHHLSIQRRLRLVLDMCSAVALAHRNLVIHRDLKPSNVLVSEDGLVKLLDFGIAKLLDGNAAAVTGPGQRWLTPGYASPEQLRGDALTTATDVYSLGVLLYVVLSGRHPDRPGADGVTSLPARPSDAVTELAQPLRRQVAKVRGTSTKGLRQQLRGDLDILVQHAMAEDPAERYGSVAELSDDIQRLLEDRPIRARQPGWLDRWRKFVRRNRLAVVASILVATSLLTGLGATLWQAQEARRAQRAAEHQQARAESALAFLTQVLETPDPAVSQGQEPTLRQIFESGDQQIDSLKEQPFLQAQILHTMGRVYKSLGSYQAALTFHRRALRLRRPRLAPDHPQVTASLVALAEVHIDLGDGRTAEKILLEALPLRERTIETDPLAVAEVLNDLTVALRLQRRWQEAKEAIAQAIAIRRQELGQGHADTQRSLSNLAVVHYHLNEFAAAEPAFQEVLEFRRRELGEAHPETLSTTYNLAVTQRRQKKYAESEGNLRSILQQRRKTLGDHHADVAATLNSLARVLRLQEKYDEAESLYRQSLEIYERALGIPNRKNAMVLNNLGDTLRSAQRPRDALVTFQQAYDARWPLGGPDQEAARALESVADLQLQLGEIDLSLDTARRAVELRRQVHPEGSAHAWRVAAAQGLLGRCLLATGRADEAAPLLQHAHAVLIQRFDADHSYVEPIAQALGELPEATASGS